MRTLGQHLYAEPGLHFDGKTRSIARQEYAEVLPFMREGSDLV
jgi:hypothetical protein